ncbi:unnamed protein product [Bursaphelenchus xylophilus]|uniref:Tyrosine--tRNA ligase n=1 Tax=Bursaphelenchus xylophilus TaxID=6326 RepID=A0A1I7RIS3_BURXY|nr:unnamed protein product [Bursaphelenchus xylophilus]CAG9119056.1 unnamed protein product [Bursaphelenchus xylophilus]
MVRAYVDRFRDLRVLQYVREMDRRGLVANSFPMNILEPGVVNTLKALPSTLYAGFDATSDSLHIGNLLIISNLIRSSLFGCRAIALIGGSTALIGDPSGKSEERNFLSYDVVRENAKNLVKQLAEIGENAKDTYGSNAQLTILNNNEWFDNMSAIEFLRLGKSFRVGDMMRMGHIKRRMEESGLSYTEFSYQILQSYDWLVLSRKYDCFFQLGGSDQLGHLDAGAHFIKNVLGKQAAGICLPLLVDKNNQKIGKSSTVTGDPVWLSSMKTSPFHLYQHFYQLHDDIAEQYFRFFSLRPFDEVQQVISHHNSSKSQRVLQKALAEEVVLLVHGIDDLQKAIQCSKVVYDGSLKDFEDLDNDTILQLFNSTKKILSKREVRTVGELAQATRDKSQYNINLIKQGAFKLNGVKFVDPEEKIDVPKLLLKNRYTLVNWGKRNYMVVDWKD